MPKQLAIFDLKPYQQPAKHPQKSNNSNIEYIFCQDEIPQNLPNGSFVSIDRKNPLKIYNIGFQPAKTIPEIPRWFLHKYGFKNIRILEPYAGSGTTLIESIIYGASVNWLDYNPLSRLICQVKTTIFDPELIIKEASQILEKSYSKTNIHTTINFANKDFWFQQSVQNGLEILRQNILKANPEVQSVLWLVFSLTVRKTSNMNDGMILAAKRPHIQQIPERSREDVFNYFKFYLNKTIDAINEWSYYQKRYPLQTQCLSSQDARYLDHELQVDAIITSPPYINAIDYIWASKFELHWLNLVANDQERLNLYSKEVGTERIPAQECKILESTGYQYLDSLIEDIYLGAKYQASKGQNQLRAKVVYKYFMDMKLHFKNAFQCLVSGGYYCFAIGDISKICGVEIPVADILANIAFDVGFYEDFRFNLLLKNRKLNLPRNVDWASTIKHDTIVVLQKSI